MFSLSVDIYCACVKLNSGNGVKQHSWNVKLQNLQYVSDNTCWIRKRSCQPRWLHVSNIYVTLIYIVHRFPPSTYHHKLTSWSAEWQRTSPASQYLNYIKALFLFSLRKVINVFPGFWSKKDRRRIPSCASTECCTNMNLMPNQREENLTTAKASLKSFLFITMILKSKDSVLSYLRIQFVSSLFDNLVLCNSEFQHLDQ